MSLKIVLLRFVRFAIDFVVVDVNFSRSEILNPQTNLDDFEGKRRTNALIRLNENRKAQQRITACMLIDDDV
jgi:hypothetical protein